MSVDAVEERVERARWPLWIGAALATIAALFGMFGPLPGSVFNAPATLQARIERALIDAGLNSGIDVRMNGQRAMLAGVAHDEDEIARAHNVALTAAGAGGRWAGGVTSVGLVDMSVGAFETPFAWRATREDGRVILSGAAPSEAARAQLMAQAKRVFPNAEISDAMHVAGGAPANNWTEVALDAITNLTVLQDGQARLVDARIIMIGEADADVVHALRAHYASPPAPFTARIEAAVTGRGPANPLLEGVDYKSGDPEQCEAAFTRLMDANVINFAPGSAEIDASSMALVNELGSVALRCDRSTIEVAGHTDNQGPAEFNMQLSQERADAVKTALSAQGVDATRLRAVGYGQTRPRANNRTASGRAANRRIEFTIEAQP